LLFRKKASVAARQLTQMQLGIVALRNVGSDILALPQCLAKLFVGRLVLV